MTTNLALSLMEEFTEATGVSGRAAPRRYLWTDAFAVCNYLGLYRGTGDERYLSFARDLVDQVHQILGRHRDDDARRGWISGLSDEEGAMHPTIGGLRIGKALPERRTDEAFDAELEWNRDGQYFHYLTKWMHALCRLGQETGVPCYRQWAAELAITAYRAFTVEGAPSGHKRMVWKMSVDLSRPMVSSMGQHDPLDGLVACLEVQVMDGSQATHSITGRLNSAVDNLAAMCEPLHLATNDPLGIGGLLDVAARLIRLTYIVGIDRRALLHRVLFEAEQSLLVFARTRLLDYSAERRLAFRELGLSIGMHGLALVADQMQSDRKLGEWCSGLLSHKPFADRITDFWCEPGHRRDAAWMDHRDINGVMLATSLAPQGYFGF